MAAESVLQEMREGGAPVEDFDRMRVDATPWLTIQAGRPGKKKVFWKRKKRSQHKKLRVFFDEVDASLKEQTARIHHVAHLLTQPKEKVRASLSVCAPHIVYACTSHHACRWYWGGAGEHRRQLCFPVGLCLSVCPPLALDRCC